MRGPILRPLRFSANGAGADPPFAAAMWAAGLAFVFLILPGIGLAVRQDQIARHARSVESAEALDRQRTSVIKFGSAAVLLSSIGDPVLLDQGRNQAARILHDYGIGTDPDWLTRPALASLPAERQAELREQLGEVLLLLSRYERIRHPVGDATTKRAWHWSQLAGECFLADQRPLFWERQHTN